MNFTLKNNNNYFNSYKNNKKTPGLQLSFIRGSALTRPYRQLLNAQPSYSYIHKTFFLFSFCNFPQQQQQPLDFRTPGGNVKTQCAV